MNRAAACTLGLLAASVVACSVRSPQSIPEHDFTTWHSRLEGTVLDAETRKPINRVKLSLFPPGPGGEGERSSWTRENGQFMFGWVPRGTYLLTSTHKNSPPRGSNGELRLEFPSHPLSDEAIDEVYCSAMGQDDSQGRLLIYVRHHHAWVECPPVEVLPERRPGTFIFRREDLERLPIH